MGTARAGRVTLFAWILRLFGFFVITPGFVSAEQLPLKVYTTADGLVRDSINRIVQDSRGFLWFCTEEGLSQFDGYTFTNYTADQGLPHRIVRDLLETRSGVYWVATDGGLCLFTPRGLGKAASGKAAAGFAPSRPEPMFIVYRAEDERSWGVTALLEDHEGQVWCGTSSGLYRLEESDGDWS